MGHIHSDTEYDFTVCGYLIHGDKTLLIKHKYLPLWGAPGGHVELHETPIDAVYHEILEEAGIEKSHLTLIQPFDDGRDLERDKNSQHIPVPFDIDTHPIGDAGHRHIDFAYIFLCDTDVVTPGEGESSEFKWFTADEIASFENRKGINAQAMYALKFASIYRNSHTG